MKPAAKQRVRNPFYAEVMRTGIHLLVPASTAPRPAVVRNPYYDRIQATGGLTIRLAPGRPPRGVPAGPTETKSVRLPPAVWKRLDAQAKREGMTRHAAIRQAILIWLRS